MSRVRIERLAVARDSRGWVAEPLGAEALAGQRNVHVVVSEPGAVRGNHLHRHATEVLTVAGPALVRTRDEDGTHDTVVGAEEVVRFILPPGVAHAVRNTGTGPGIIVSFSSHPHDPEAPDVERVGLL